MCTYGLGAKVNNMYYVSCEHNNNIRLSLQASSLISGQHSKVSAESTQDNVDSVILNSIIQYQSVPIVVKK